MGDVVACKTNSDSLSSTVDAHTRTRDNRIQVIDPIQKRCCDGGTWPCDGAAAAANALEGLVLLLLPLLPIPGPAAAENFGLLDDVAAVNNRERGTVSEP